LIQVIAAGVTPSPKLDQPHGGDDQGAVRGEHDLVFAPHDAATEGLIIHYVEEALERWEPRIEVQEVAVSTDPIVDGALLIEIRYQVRDTHDERSIVHPFYLTGEEEPI
jgi:hypothetical protein